MKTDTRYIIRLANTEGHSPVDGETLLQKVRRQVSSYGSAMNLRVSGPAIEFDLFCEPQKTLDPVLAAVQSIGSVLTVKRLDPQAPALSPEATMSEARSLFNEERYWEVHEVLEGLWKKTEGREKELIQGLILAAAALVHVQKNQWNVVWPMLLDASRRLENQPFVYYGLDIQNFLSCLKKALATKTLKFPTI